MLILGWLLLNNDTNNCHNLAKLHYMREATFLLLTLKAASVFRPVVQSLNGDHLQNKCSTAQTMGRFNIFKDAARIYLTWYKNSTAKCSHVKY